jgi:hypothetical protein
MVTAPSLSLPMDDSKRDSTARRDSSMMTPPMSPGHSEPSVDDDGDAIVVDTEPRYSGPDSLTPHTAAAQCAAMEVDNHEEQDAQSVSNASQPPLRLLEDEKVHLQKTGLKLTDFEVRGTLGTSSFL